MPTNVTCSDISQSRIANRSPVIDVNVRTSVRRRVPGRGEGRSIAHPPFDRKEDERSATWLSHPIVKLVTHWLERAAGTSHSEQ